MNGPGFAIYYHPDGFDTKNRPLMGRRAAGKAFLDAWLDRRMGGDVYCLAARGEDFEHFKQQAVARGFAGQAHWLPLDRPETVSATGALYFPGPDIGTNAWRRHRRDPKGYSLIGVTHTICTKAVMDGVCEWLTAPVEEWDAVICTSQAVRVSLERLLSAEREHLARRLGATKFTLPQLPVIPLGVNTKEFAPDAALRASTRAKLNIGADDVAFLFVGRLSVYGKAHPAPMMLALERAAKQTGKKLHLLLTGWYATDGLRKAFAEAAAHWCPSVTIHDIDGREDDARNGAWRAGDVFVSLVDNVQETFGLTPVEAMAAGLPVVVSDWDGYRDTVRHGIDGFRIPTLMSPAPLGEVFADRYAADIDSYDVYLARTTYHVAVDVEATTKAFALLIEDPALRRRMGEAALGRARATYDWQQILAQYEDLAGKLGEIRAGGAVGGGASEGRVWPARLSPFDMFFNYTTRVPQRSDMITLATPDLRHSLEGLMRDSNAAIDNREGLTRTLEGILRDIGQGVSFGELLDKREAADRPHAIAGVMRLAKFGIVALRPASGVIAPLRGPSDTGA